MSEPTIGSLVTINKVTGTLLEVIETTDTKKYKIETAEGRIAIVSYIKQPKPQALDGMRLL
jgi:hypothetical protein